MASEDIKEKCCQKTGTCHYLTSQNVILKKGRGQHTKYIPYAFIRNGTGMLSWLIVAKGLVPAIKKTFVYIICRHLLNF